MKNIVPLEAIQVVGLETLDRSGPNFDFKDCGMRSPDLPKSYMDPKHDITYWGPRP